MTKSDWLINIDNAALLAAKNFGEKAVSAVFKKYEATYSGDLNEYYYDAVFNELDFMCSI